MLASEAVCVWPRETWPQAIALQTRGREQRCQCRSPWSMCRAVPCRAVPVPVSRLCPSPRCCQRASLRGLSLRCRWTAADHPASGSVTPYQNNSLFAELLLSFWWVLVYSRAVCSESARNCICESDKAKAFTWCEIWVWFKALSSSWK